MSKKAIVPRERARRDIEDAIDYYSAEAGEQVALRFLDSLQDTYRAISAYPAAGSTRYAHELNLPGLRTRLVKRFPYLVFYREGSDHIDVWRVLHAGRDIPTWMQAPPNSDAD